MLKKPAKKILELSYNESDSLAIAQLYLTIEEYIQKGEPIPAEVAKELLGLFGNPTAEAILSRKQLLQLAKERILTFFRASKGKYNFKGTFTVDMWLEPPVISREYANSGSKTNFEPFIKRQFSFDDMIDRLIQSLDSDEGFKKTNDKLGLLKHSYSVCANYLKPIYRDVPLSHYNLTIIAGYVIVQFGYLISENEFKRQPNTTGTYLAFLHQKAKYHLATPSKSRAKK